MWVAFLLLLLAVGSSATCTDNVKNDGEEGIDCGGPCSACTGFFGACFLNFLSREDFVWILQKWYTWGFFENRSLILDFEWFEIQSRTASLDCFAHFSFFLSFFFLLLFFIFMGRFMCVCDLLNTAHLSLEWCLQSLHWILWGLLSVTNVLWVCDSY